MSTIFLSAVAVPTSTSNATTVDRISVSCMQVGAILQQCGFMRPKHWFGIAIFLAVLGSGAPAVEAKGSVRITFTTTPVPGTYSPNNVVAAWIQNAAGTHQRTVGLWSAVRT